ncbi:MAG: type IV CRISPR-associated protein Csf2 [Lentimicrobiaceae bacterium]|nr:type IV CRISPR-associated protein Csf2 [Lentimicrobiaceae bacterium]
MTNIQICGSLKLTSHLHVASPISARFTKRDDRYVINYTGQDGKPLTRTMTYNVLQNDGSMVRDIPYMPGNGLRGRLRRCATEFIFKKFKEIYGSDMESKFTIDTFHGMTCGAVTGVPTSSMASVSGIQKEYKHLFLGLFGGGPNITQGKYTVSDLIPVCAVTQEIGSVPSDINTLPSTRSYLEGEAKTREISSTSTDLARGNGLTNIYHIFRKDDVVNGNFIVPLDQFTNFDEDAQAWLAEIAGKKEGESKTSVSNMVAFEAIIPGTNMWFDMKINDATQEQFGLMLNALLILARDKRLGGHVSMGLGQFNALDLKIKVNEESIPLFVVKHDVLHLNTDEPLIDDADRAVNAFLQTVDYDYFNEMYVREEAKPKKTKKVA